MSGGPLLCAPAGACAALRTIEAEAERTGPGLLTVRFRALGRIAGIVIPGPAAPERTDELWKTTCFEAFVGAEGKAYREFNLSPSGQWAAYSFTGYREGMTPLDARPPGIKFRLADDALELTATLDLSSLARADWQVGLTAVIEAADGATSYWALQHAPGRPDFHHPDCFALRFPAPRAA